MKQYTLLLIQDVMIKRECFVFSLDISMQYYAFGLGYEPKELGVCTIIALF